MLKSSTLEEELDKFEIIERNYIEQDAAPKSAEVAKSDQIPSSTSALGGGWKAGFLVPSSEKKTRKKETPKARVEENKQTSISQSSQEQREILSHTSTAQKVTPEAVIPEKEVKKAFSGSIVERF